MLACPNCGSPLNAQDYEGTSSKLPMFNCPKCNYRGLPINIRPADYKKAKFANKPPQLPLFKTGPRSSYILTLLLIVLVLAAALFYPNFVLFFGLSAFLLLLYIVFSIFRKKNE